MARTITAPAAGARVVPRSSKRLLSLRGDDYLVARLRCGDEVAFEVLYDRYTPGMLSFCFHMLRSREEAEDAVSHVFTSAYNALLRDARDIDLKPWLYAIAKNRCLSMLRVRREQPDDQLDGITPALHDEVEQRAELRELLSDLHDLPEDQRAALLLSEAGDLSHAEIAQVLDCEVPNVKGLVFRARSGLIERREARGVACEDIQAELATTRGGGLRRGKLRHHLRACSACTSYLDDVRRQRKMMALVLPVVPTAGLKKSVLATTVGLGGGAGGGGGGVVTGGGALVAATSPATGATLAKVAVVGVLVGGSGLAGQAVVEGQPDPATPPPAAEKAPAGPSHKPGAAADDPRPAGERRRRSSTSEPGPRGSKPNAPQRAEREPDGQHKAAGDAPQKAEQPPAQAPPTPVPPAVAPVIPPAVVAPLPPRRSGPKEERVYETAPTTGKGKGKGRPGPLPGTTTPVPPQRSEPVIETAPAPETGRGRGKGKKDKSDPDAGSG